MALTRYKKGPVFYLPFGALSKKEKWGFYKTDLGLNYGQDTTGLGPDCVRTRLDMFSVCDDGVNLVKRCNIPHPFPSPD